eukprot:CCRYP_009041-RA/>CCRYP_009041-RA protein AED:0.10 eAED:0.10 QI:0/0/0.5/1/0/0/2/1554/67
MILWRRKRRPILEQTLLQIPTLSLGSYLATRTRAITEESSIPLFSHRSPHPSFARDQQFTVHVTYNI